MAAVGSLLFIVAVSPRGHTNRHDQKEVTVFTKEVGCRAKRQDFIAAGRQHAEISIKNGKIYLRDQKQMVVYDVKK